MLYKLMVEIVVTFIEDLTVFIRTNDSYSFWHKE
jgi:hypothetical protein